MKKSKGIPSDEEFERASRAMELKARGLDQVREAVLAHFAPRNKVHEFFILDQRDVDFRAYVFFVDESTLKESQLNGLTEEIRNFVHAALEREGRGSRGEIDVAFEFDSHENVKQKFAGDYWLRLRA